MSESKANTLQFKACRINGDAFVELFEGSKAIALVRHEKNNKKDEWPAMYERACLEADRLNALMGVPPCRPKG